MQDKSNFIRITPALAGGARERKPFLFALFVLILTIATPVLADYLGPDRTTTTSEVDTYDYGVWTRDNNKVPYCLDKNGKCGLQLTIPGKVALAMQSSLQAIKQTVGLTLQNSLGLDIRRGRMK